MKALRAQLQRQRQEIQDLMPPPPEPHEEPEPEWFVRWNRALAAEIYAQAGWGRDCAQTWESDLGTLHRIFSCAYHFFIRNLGREATEEEWVAWLVIAEETAQPPDTEEARGRKWVWLMLHHRKWQEERQGVVRSMSELCRQLLVERPVCSIRSLMMSDAASGHEGRQETPCIH
jgi:hypothetical protein